MIRLAATINRVSKGEVILPYLAIFFYFLSAKLSWSSRYYLGFSLAVGIYFLVFRLLKSENREVWFHAITSLMFSSILIFSGLLLINPGIAFIRLLSGMLGLTSFGLLLYRHFTGRLSVAQFFLFLGFCLLAGLYLMI